MAVSSGTEMNAQMNTRIYASFVILDGFIRNSLCIAPILAQVEGWTELSGTDGRSRG